MRRFALIAIILLFLLQTIATVIVNHKMVRTMQFQSSVIEHQRLVIEHQYRYLLMVPKAKPDPCVVTEQ